MTIGDFLRKDRESKCLTQEEYSKLIGISRSTLASLETNSRLPSKSNSRKLVSYFKKPLSELIGDEKISKLSNLETTNLLIDSLIDKGQIISENIDDKVKSLIWESLTLEIQLKLKLKNSKNKRDLKL